MLVEDIVVEACISDCETSELSCVSIGVPAAFDCRWNEPKLKKFFIEKPSMSAKIANKVADFGSNRSILMHNKNFELIVGISIMNIFIKILGYSSELRDKTQCINNQINVILNAQQGIFIDHSKTISLDKLLSKLFRTLGTEDQSWYEGNTNWNCILLQVLERI